MSKSFNVERVANAMVATYNASWVKALVEERCAHPKANPIEALRAAVLKRVEAGDLDAKTGPMYLSKAKTMIECPLSVLMDAVAEGYGITGVAQRIVAVVGARGGASGKRSERKPKAGGTVAADKAVEAVKEAANDTEVLMVALRGYVAKATKLVRSDDADRFSNALLEAIACLNRKIGK